jgi:hypothetical protein
MMRIMTTMAKEKKSELQMAVDRAHEMQTAITKSRANLTTCLAEVEKYERALAEAVRNLNDTQGFLSAQEGKLSRELEAAHEILNKVNPRYSEWNMCKEAVRKY